MTSKDVRFSQATTKKAAKKTKTSHKALMATAIVSGKVKTRRSTRRTPTNFMSPLSLYHANPLERIEMVRQGLPTFFLRKTADILHVSQEALNQTLRIPRSTVARKKNEDEPLSQAQSERLIGVMMLIGQVEAIMADSGDDTVQFDAGKWVSEWIEEPLPALGNRTAGEFMDTAEGQQLVSRVLAQSVAGAYV